MLNDSSSYDEPEEHTCPSCDALISPTALTCPCGVFLQEPCDPFEGMTFEERMQMEVILENEERAEYGAPLIPVMF